MISARAWQSPWRGLHPSTTAADIMRPPWGATAPWERRGAVAQRRAERVITRTVRNGTCLDFSLPLYGTQKPSEFQHKRNCDAAPCPRLCYRLALPWWFSAAGAERALDTTTAPRDATRRQPRTHQYEEGRSPRNGRIPCRDYTRKRRLRKKHYKHKLCSVRGPTITAGVSAHRPRTPPAAQTIGEGAPRAVRPRVRAAVCGSAYCPQRYGPLFFVTALW
jgi:hypothetical protein